MEEELEALASQDGAETELETGLSYRGEEPVRIRVSKRDQRYDVDDTGAAVRLSGEPAGWFDTAEGLMKAHGMDVDRHGVVSVRGVDGREVKALVLSVADTSLALYSALVQPDAEVGLDSDTGVE